ncbi:cytochrome b [Microvirga roseola]|uniref:cytochrome b n=1 Tax=Microvirga roseola TaxID=2883126 RepID=UPI001E344358|nr:cytochrome b/b6 domain-containing protein [Microvirga roseola]
MTMRSTSERYGTVALALHWTSAALILALIPLGFAMQSAPDAARLGLYRVHVGIGILVGLLTLARLLWWLALDRRPVPSVSHTLLQRRLAKAVHAGFYGVVLILAVSGIGMMAASPLGEALASGKLALMPADLMNLPPRLAHGAMARLLMALLVLHVAGALYHHWVGRDGTLGRMAVRLR